MAVMRRLLLPAVLAVLVASCAGGAEGGAPPDEAAGVHVVATTSILGDVVRAVAGDAAEVTVLIPPGIDAHGFAPSARDAATLREADLVVANGLGLEEALADTIAAAEEDGIAVVRVAEEVDPLPVGGSPADEDHAEEDHADEHAEEDHAEEDHADEHAQEGHAEEEHADEHAADDHADDHAHGELDAHVWFDPIRMAEAAELLAALLADVEGDGGRTDDEWAQRGAAYAQELRAVDEEIAGILAAVPEERRELVTDHDNLRYFAERYGFEVVGTVIPGTSSQAQPSTREIADLAALIEARDVPAIFTDASAGSERLAQVLADEVGRDVAVVGLYTEALGEDGSGADTLVGLLRTDARRIADALS